MDICRAIEIDLDGVMALQAANQPERGGTLSASLPRSRIATMMRATVECNSVEQTSFFGREFDAVIALGLLFLLPRDAQALVIENVARALVRGGRFLFTAPPQGCQWAGAMTGKRSQSLGAEAYPQLLETTGLVLEGEADDEGANHYYMAFKP